MNTEDTELVADLRQLAAQATNLAQAIEDSSNGGEVCWPAEIRDGLLGLSSLANRLERGRRWSGR